MVGATSAAKGGKDKSRAQLWETILLDAVNHNGHKYISTIQKLMAGCFIIMLIKQTKTDSVSKLKKYKVTAGLGGLTGNKGATAIRFEYEAKRFLFINVYLIGGKNSNKTRIQNIKQILQQTAEDFKSLEHDYIILFGDMNWRINLTNNQIR